MQLNFLFAFLWSVVHQSGDPAFSLTILRKRRAHAMHTQAMGWGCFDYIQCVRKTQALHRSKMALRMSTRDVWNVSTVCAQDGRNVIGSVVDDAPHQCRTEWTQPPIAATGQAELPAGGQKDTVWQKDDCGRAGSSDNLAMAMGRRSTTHLHGRGWTSREHDEGPGLYMHMGTTRTRPREEGACARRVQLRCHNCRERKQRSRHYTMNLKRNLLRLSTVQCVFKQNAAHNGKNSIGGIVHEKI